MMYVQSCKLLKAFLLEKHKSELYGSLEALFISGQMIVPIAGKLFVQLAWLAWVIFSFGMTTKNNQHVNSM